MRRLPIVAPSVNEHRIAKALIETVGLNVELPIAVAFVPRFSY